MEIMRKIRKDREYREGFHTQLKGITYYDNSDDYTYFTLRYSGISVNVSGDAMIKLEIENPRGIVYFDLYLWLMEIKRRIGA